jgi:polysaccharide export outer membrane protein
MACAASISDSRMPASVGSRRGLAVGLVAILVGSAAAEAQTPEGVAYTSSHRNAATAEFLPERFISDGSELYEGARIPPLGEYRVRIDDTIQLLLRTARETEGRPYLLTPGDQLRLSSVTVPRLNLQFSIEPDGMITVPILGRIRAAGRTIEGLREDLLRRAAQDVREPDLALSAVSIFSQLEEFQSAIANLHSHGELAWFSKVSPDGTVQIPAIGSVAACGLTVEELERELMARFDRVLEGIRVTVILSQKAPSYISILGEVRSPNRVRLDRPTSASQALSLAGGWINGADLSRVVVFRRDSQWRLVATSLDLRDSLNGQSLANGHEIWLRDGDIVLVPKTGLRRFDDMVQLVFTDGLYRLLPLDASVRVISVDGAQNEVRDVIAQPPQQNP